MTEPRVKMNKTFDVGGGKSRRAASNDDKRPVTETNKTAGGDKMGFFSHFVFRLKPTGSTRTLLGRAEGFSLDTSQLISPITSN